MFAVSTMAVKHIIKLFITEIMVLG